MTSLEKALVGAYLAITAVVFVVFIILAMASLKGRGTGGEEGFAFLLAILAVFWPFFILHWVRSLRNWWAGAPAAKKSTGGQPAGPASLPPPASSSHNPAGGSHAGRIITATPGQRCKRCGSVIAATDAPRAWGRDAVCSGCAADLGLSE